MPVIIRSFHPSSFFLDDPVPIMVAPPTPREVLAELQKYASNPPTQILEDDDLRRDIYLAAQKLQLRLEDAPSAMQRLTIGHSCESAVLQVAFDLGLFPYLASEGTPKRLDSIKTNIKANEGLLLRVLRFLAASGVVCEVHNDAYTLAPSCHLFGEQSFVTAARDCDEIVSQIFASTPAFLADIGHQNPTNRRNGPTNKAIGLPDADMFEVLKVKYPEKMTSLAHFLGSMTKDSEKPHEIYPVKQRLIQGAEHVPETYIWVDVGGGMGLYTAALKRAYPSLPGKCVVQEQEAMVAVAKSLGADKEVDYMSHDFLTDQPIKGMLAGVICKDYTDTSQAPVRTTSVTSFTIGETRNRK